MSKKVKTEKDYVKELVEIYPVMSEEEMERVVGQITTVVTKYLRGGHRGVSFGTKSSVLEDTVGRFKMTKSTSKSADNIFTYKRKKKAEINRTKNNGTTD